MSAIRFCGAPSLAFCMVFHGTVRCMLWYDVITVWCRVLWYIIWYGMVLNILCYGIYTVLVCFLWYGTLDLYLLTWYRGMMFFVLVL